MLSSVIFGKKIHQKSKKGSYGNITQRHFWQKNPDYISDQLPIKFEEYFFLGISPSVILGKKFHRKSEKFSTSKMYLEFVARDDAGWYSQNSKKLRISIFIQNCAFWNFLPEMTLHNFLFLVWIFLPEMTLGNIPGFSLVLGMNHFHHVIFLFGDVTWPGSSYI